METEKIKKVEQLLNDHAKMITEYETDGDGLYNYSHLPQEENFMHAMVYKDFFDSFNYTNNEAYLSTLAEKYGYSDYTDMLQDLYMDCDIDVKWNNGYYYKPIDTISFGYYRNEEIETELPENIQEILNSLSKKEIESINCDVCLEKYQDLWYGYIYLCGGVSFELSLENAIDYLEANK